VARDQLGLAAEAAVVSGDNCHSRSVLRDHPIDQTAHVGLGEDSRNRRHVEAEQDTVAAEADSSAEFGTVVLLAVRQEPGRIGRNA